jgi:hypothetical protein
MRVWLAAGVAAVAGLVVAGASGATGGNATTKTAGSRAGFSAAGGAATSPQLAFPDGLLLQGFGDSTHGPTTAADVMPAVSAQADVIVGERDGFVDLAVSLSPPGLDPVSVTYATAPGTAHSGTGCDNDYKFAGGVLTFEPGEVKKVVPVQIFDCTDPVVEGFESFSLSLSGDPNIARPRVRVGIVDNDHVVATPRLFVRDVVVDEMDGSALVSVLLGGTAGEASNGPVSVDYSTNDGTATAGTDYGLRNGTLRFEAGETVKTVVVPITDDVTPEPSEGFALTLSNATNATIADGSATVVIGASDAPRIELPAVSAQADVIVGEGDGFVDLVLSLSAPALDTMWATYAVADGTAQDGSHCDLDYYPSSGLQIAFLPGETTKVVRVQILDCPIVEGLEWFTLSLSGNTNIARRSVRVLIIDDSGALANIAVTPANAQIAVGADRQFTATGTFSDAETFDLTTFATWSSANSAVAAISSGGLAHGVSSGTSTIRAIVGGIGDSTVLTVGLNAQSITFAPLVNKTYGDPDFTVSAIASSGLAVSFAATGNCTVSGATVHITGAGSCTITASQAGDSNYGAATSVSQTFSIASPQKANQTITFGTLPSKTYGDADFAVSASASSSLTVFFGASGSCTVDGSMVHITAAGSCTVTASQLGDVNYNAAAPVSQTFSIAKRSQTITFGGLLGKTYGDADFTVGATASSGLAVSFAASGTCTATGTTVHLTGPGSCTVTASQTGDANFNAAPTVSQTFSIASKPLTPPKTCTVPKVVGKSLTAASSAIKKAHCRVGTVRRAYSKKVKKRIVIAQSRAAGKVVPLDTKINLVVSRGRKPLIRRIIGA